MKTVSDNKADMKTNVKGTARRVIEDEAELVRAVKAALVRDEAELVRAVVAQEAGDTRAFDTMEERRQKEQEHPNFRCEICVDGKACRNNCTFAHSDE
jgi:hypothetical protein